jgi:Zn-dependent metalloprotease
LEQAEISAQSAIIYVFLPFKHSDHMKIFTPLLLLVAVIHSAFSQNMLTGQKAMAIAPGSELLRTSRFAGVPDYIRFSGATKITTEQVVPYLQQYFKMNTGMSLKLLNVSGDKLGYTHYRYQQTMNGIPLQGTMYIVHTKDGIVTSMNGMIFPSIPAAQPSMTETAALGKALQYVNATSYKWENEGEESLLKMMKKDANATWYPKGELNYAPEKGVYDANTFKLTYRFDIFASQPMSRQYVYVDAQSGEIVLAVSRIETNNPVQGTAVTAYSGTQTIVTDSEAVNKFYLRDTTRGNGVITLNMHHSTTDYAGASNFTDADNYWNNASAQQDQYATDAHFGLEKTYDLYKNAYNRNSLDDDGLELYAYVHFDNYFVNAFWDGTSMNFGDGDGGGITPLTTLDITGHEMTHGITEYTCNLNYSGESGGLNESFSDLAGEMVERLGKGTNDWLIGEEIGIIIRYFSNPSLDGASASTYGDNNWDNNTDVHYWSGPQNHWFYILSVGDTATNNQGTPYSVAGIGMDDAHAIAYRNQSVYLTPSSDYADARFYAILSAKELFGGCSMQDIACTNAWHAVEVGPEFVPGVTADFTVSATSICSLNTAVLFTNESVNGESYHWDFGDGTTSTDINPSHGYTDEGTYSVSLYTDGGTCGEDSLLEVNYITVDLPEPPTAVDTSTCANSPAVLTGTAGGVITWYSSATGGSPVGTGSPFYTDPVPTTTTFYAENDIPVPPQQAAAPNNSFGTGSYFTFTNPHYLVFDAYDNLTIQTVTVYSNQSGVRTIELLDNTGDQINSLSVNIASGTVVVTLDFPVTAGTGYALGLQDGSLTNLYRNQSGTTFPYTVSGLISITGNDIPDEEHYYYFYDWKVQKAPCASVRIPVKVDVYPTPNALFTFNNTGTEVAFTNGTTGNATSYEWNFGDGATSTQSDPVHDYGTPGNYNVQLIACIGDCCDTVNHTVSMITGVDGIDGLNSVSVFPNPFENYLQLNYTAKNSSSLTVDVTDVLGRILLSSTNNILGGKGSVTIPASELSAGVYFVRLTQGRNSQAFKVVKNGN